MNGLFRELTEKEIIEFREWADKNFVPGSVICEVWHPVVQKRCVELLEEWRDNLADTARSAVDFIGLANYNDRQVFAMRMVNKSYTTGKKFNVFREWDKEVDLEIEEQFELK